MGLYAENKDGAVERLGVCDQIYVLERSLGCCVKQTEKDKIRDTKKLL